MTSYNTLAGSEAEVKAIKFENCPRGMQVLTSKLTLNSTQRRTPYILQPSSQELSVYMFITHTHTHQDENISSSSHTVQNIRTGEVYRFIVYALFFLVFTYTGQNVYAGRLNSDRCPRL